MPVAGADRVAIDALGGDALAAAALDRVVEAQQHGTARREGVDQEPSSSRAAARAPGGPVQHPVVVDEVPLPPQPAIRRRLVTVRLPGARMAPISSTSAWRQLRWQNSGREG